MSRPLRCPRLTCAPCGEDSGSVNPNLPPSSATLRNWDQGRTQPDGPARVLLAVIAGHPEAVEDALEGGVAVIRGAVP